MQNCAELPCSFPRSRSVTKRSGVEGSLRLSTDSADDADSSGQGSLSSCPLDRLPPSPLVIRQSTIGNSSDDSSPRSSASWSQGYLSSIPGRDSDGNVDCDSARTSGRNLTRYSARNSTRGCRRCSRGSGRSSGGNSRTSSPHRSSGSSLGRDFGDHGESYGGGIGGVGTGTGARVLGLGKLGPFP